MEPKGLLPHLQEPTTGPCAKAYESVHTPLLFI
jgi:hypothetical protein